MRYLLTLAFILLATPVFAVFTRTYTVCEGGGCDYTTVVAAETALDQDLVANDSALTIEIQNTWVSVDGFVLINGWTTDATRFLTITAVGDARAGAAWSTTAYRIVRLGTGFQNAEDYTVVDGIQVENTTSDATNGDCFTISNVDATVKNCFAKGGGGSALIGIDVGNSSTTLGVIRNNIVIDCGNKGIDISTAAGGLKADNNTVENCNIGIFTSFLDAIARNNIIWNCTTPLSGSFNANTLSEENYTDASSLAYGAQCGSCGAGDQLSQSDPFVNLAGENYSLAASTAPIDAGKDLSAAFTDAIGGKTRDSNFDKGADEFIAAAASGQKVMIRK